MSRATSRQPEAERLSPSALPRKARDSRSLAGHAVLMATYGLGTSAAVLALRRRDLAAPRPTLFRLAILALATQHLSRLITKDSVTAPIRAPFTRFVAPAGEGEVDEDAVGTGLRHAVGELLTCPYCIAQWVATALMLGLTVAPELTDGFATACALARTSDYLQLAYERLRHG